MDIELNYTTLLQNGTLLNLSCLLQKQVGYLGAVFACFEILGHDHGVQIPKSISKEELSLYRGDNHCNSVEKKNVGEINKNKLSRMS